MNSIQVSKFFLRLIEIAVKTVMQALLRVYYNLVSIYIHFGYSFRTASKDFIK